MRIFHAIKFIIALCIVAYDCHIESKYTLLWVLVAIMYLVLFALSEIEDYIDKKFKTK